MGRLDTEADDSDWKEADDTERPVDLDDDFADTDDAVEEATARVPRGAGSRRLVARRLIEQAREQRDLSRSLADFDDYFV